MNLLLFCVDFTWNNPLGYYGRQINVVPSISILVTLQEEQASLIEQHHLRLRAQQKEHAEELQQLRELHHQDLEEARKQHSDMLEHLNRARTMENDALKEASSYSRCGNCSLTSLSPLEVSIRVIHLHLILPYICAQFSSLI